MTIGDIFFKNAKQYKDSKMCKYYSYTPLYKNLEDENSKIRNLYLEDFEKALNQKLKTSPSFQLEIVEIKHIYNPKFLIEHRKLYYKFTEEAKEEVIKQSKNPIRVVAKHLLAFHGKKRRIYSKSF